VLMVHHDRASLVVVLWKAKLCLNFCWVWF